MTVYRFLPKSIIGSYISAFKINPWFTTLCTIGSFLFFELVYKLGGFLCAGDCADWWVRWGYCAGDY
jgi:hypothetical protein